MRLFSGKKTVLRDDAPPGRDTPPQVSPTHYVNGAGIVEPFPDGAELAVVGMGCFWGAEKAFWQTPGVISTAVGYAGGVTPNPTYQETCTGRTGHTEVVLVVFDPGQITYAEVLKVFWEGHDPTQGNRQGNDHGTQYRSAIYTFDEAQMQVALASKAMYGAELAKAGYGPISTEIEATGPFYYAEDYHQQYLAKNPAGYCGIGGTGVACPVGLGVGDPAVN